MPWQISSAPFEPFGEVDRRALAVGLGILLRHVEDVRRVAVVVVRPVGHRPQRRAGGEDVRRREHRHQRDEPAVAAAVDADALRIDLLRGAQVLRAVDDVLEILAAHVTVDRRAPVAAVAGARAVVDVEHDVAARREQVVEHVLAEVDRPVLVRVLQVAGAVHEDDCRRASDRACAPIISGVNSRAYTSTPSRALKVMTFGSIHLNARHSSIGVVVTCFAGAPGAFGIT